MTTEGEILRRVNYRLCKLSGALLEERPIRGSAIRHHQDGGQLFHVRSPQTRLAYIGHAAGTGGQLKSASMAIRDSVSTYRSKPASRATII